MWGVYEYLQEPSLKVLFILAPALLGLVYSKVNIEGWRGVWAGYKEQNLIGIENQDDRTHMVTMRMENETRVVWNAS